VLVQESQKLRSGYFSNRRAVFHMVGSSRLVTLAPLPRGLLERSGNIIAVKHKMDFIVVLGLVSRVAMK